MKQLMMKVARCDVVASGYLCDRRRCYLQVGEEIVLKVGVGHDCGC